SQTPRGFIAKLDSRGGHVWSQLVGPSDPSDGVVLPTSVAVSKTEQIVLGGSFKNCFQKNGAACTIAGNSAANAFVQKFDMDGTPQWVRAAATSSMWDSAEALAVAFDPVGSVFVTGYFAGQPSGGLLDSLKTAGGMDAFLVHLGPNGSVLWTK